VGELGEKARDELGAPAVIVHYAMAGQRVVGYRIRVIHPSTDDAVGVEEDYVLNYVDEWVPSVVREEIDRRLRVR
jgi:hypothetical protein